MDKIKLNEFRNAYKNEKFYVIADFNRTLTIPGFSTSFSSISKGEYLDKDYVIKRDEMFRKYFPYETGENGASIEERKRVVNKWFTDHLALLVKKKISKSILKKIVMDTKNLNDVREGFVEFFEILKNKKIPLTIISGGLGDIIDLTLKKYKVSKNNIDIISNYFIWDNNGVAIDYVKECVIDTINKDRDYSNLKIDKNSYVLVLGDTPDDLEVLSKLKYQSAFSIGYKVKEKGTVSKRVFDVSLDKNESLNSIIKLLEEIVK